MKKRIAISKRIQLLVFKRDNWTCRYCGDPVFFSPALKLLNGINPRHGYYHKNGKTGRMLPLLQWKWASVDHINPHSKGGEHSEENFVTACWECNLKWREKTDGKPNQNKCNKIAKDLNWDGFSGLYLELSKKNDEWTKLLEEK
jgi:5-methylcytosine-specific restriction endonuclease McrA